MSEEQKNEQGCNLRADPVAAAAAACVLCIDCRILFCYIAFPTQKPLPLVLNDYNSRSLLTMMQLYHLYCYMFIHSFPQQSHHQFLKEVADFNTSFHLGVCPLVQETSLRPALQGESQPTGERLVCHIFRCLSNTFPFYKPVLIRKKHYFSNVISKGKNATHSTCCSGSLYRWTCVQPAGLPAALCLCCLLMANTRRKGEK